MVCLKIVRALGPDVGGVHLRTGLVDLRRKVRAVLPEAERLLDVGRGGLPHRIGNRPIADPVVAAADLCRRPAAPSSSRHRGSAKKSIARWRVLLMRSTERRAPSPGKSRCPCRPRRSVAPRRAGRNHCQSAGREVDRGDRIFPPAWCTLLSRAICPHRVPGKRRPTISPLAVPAMPRAQVIHSRSLP